MAVKHFNPDV